MPETQQQQQQQPFCSQSSSPSNDTNEETSSEEDDDDDEGEAMTPSMSALAVSPDDDGSNSSGCICCLTTTTTLESSSPLLLPLPTKKQQQGRRDRLFLGALAFLSLILCASLAGALSMGRKLHETTAAAILRPLYSGNTGTVADNEPLEHNRVCRVVQKYCAGSWSNVTRTYRPKKNRLVMDKHAHHHREQRRQDPSVLVPPAQQLEIAFDEGIILRIPREVGGRQQDQAASSPPRRRLVWEIDFWDAATRRTAVVSYRPRRVPWKPKRWYLDDVAAVQMRREEGLESSVGHDAAPKVPREETTTAHEFDHDCNIQAFQIHQVESVQLDTMERQRKRSSSSKLSIADINERGLIHERIVQAFHSSTTTGQQTNGDAAGTSANERIFRGLLSNQMVVSLPASIGTMEATVGPRRIQNNDDEKPPVIRTMFALCGHDDGGRIINLPVVEVTYNAETAKAQTVTLYSLRR
jgi:hypothetical protein